MDNAFIKWMLSVTSAVVVAIMGAIFTTIVSLREDMAQVREQVVSLKTNVEAVRELQTRVDEHEIRIRWIEHGTAHYESSPTPNYPESRIDSNTSLSPARSPN